MARKKIYRSISEKMDERELGIPENLINKETGEKYSREELREQGLAINGRKIGKRTTQSGKNLHGRPKGVKNKTTLLKEAMANGFDVMVKRDFKKVVSAVMTKAIDGDMVAAKLILDRVVPLTKAIDSREEGRSGMQVTINVGSLENAIKIVDEEEPDMTVISNQ